MNSQNLKVIVQFNLLRFYYTAHLFYPLCMYRGPNSDSDILGA